MGYKNDYEIDAVKNTIIGKEQIGKDAKFERGLLKSWAKYEGWEYAGEALESCGRPPRQPYNQNPGVLMKD